ncbi:MAG: glycosyltransferase [Kiritimatiellia bacterium]
MKALSLAYSMADQNFYRTKSVGIFNYSYRLLMQLLNAEEFERLVILANRSLKLPSGLPSWVSVEWHANANAGRLQRLWWDQFGLYRRAAQMATQWLFLPKGFASFIQRCPLYLAASVHDTMPFYYRKHYPKAYPQAELWYFCRCLRATLEQARVVFTDSEFTRECVLRLASELGVLPHAVVVAGVGFDEPRVLPEKKTDSIICLASPWPHKLTAWAVDFLERWRVKTRYAGKIHVVGRIPDDLKKPAASAWHWHERLPSEEFASLLASARVLVYFTAFEGFGMPPVEATLVGTCPVFSDIPVLREVMGDAGFAFTNDGFSSFERAMECALSVSNEQMLAWKKSLLTRHCWHNVVRRILQALQA